MAHLSIRNADSLYWTGRYLQRFGILAKESIYTFDEMIDESKTESSVLFEKLGHPVDGVNAAHFFENISYAVLLPCIENARENLIAIRDVIDDDAFMPVNIIHDTLHKATHITPKLIENMLREVYGFWGVVLLKTFKNRVHFLLEFGQVVELIDLKLRMFEDISMVLFDIQKLNDLGKQLSLEYESITLSGSSIPALIDKVNQKIETIIAYES